LGHQLQNRFSLIKKIGLPLALTRSLDLSHSTGSQQQKASLFSHLFSNKAAVFPI
jgi:hypothetical protein